MLIWIHGGGYGLNQGDADFSSLINDAKNTFIAVVIQYRVSGTLRKLHLRKAYTHLARSLWFSVVR